MIEQPRIASHAKRIGIRYALLAVLSAAPWVSAVGAGGVTWTKQAHTAGWPGFNGYQTQWWDPVSHQMIHYGIPSNSTSIYSTDLYFYNDAANLWTHVSGTHVTSDKCSFDTPTQPGERHPGWQMAIDTKRNVMWLFGGVDQACFAALVNTNGTAVTWAGSVDENKFVTVNTSWVGGTYLINNVPYTIASITDDTHMTLTTSAGVQTGVLGQPAAPNQGQRTDMYDLTLNADPTQDVWTRVPISHVPVNNDAAEALVYDPDDDVLFFFGYDTGSNTHDHWIYCDTQQNPTPGTPTAKQAAAGCAHPDDWTEISPAGGILPPGTYFTGTVYDTATKKVIQFAGDTGGSVSQNQTWAYDVPTHQWTQKCRGSCTPPPVYTGGTVAQPAMAYNSNTHTIFYHQNTNTGAPADWEYDPVTDTWTLLPSVGGGTTDDLDLAYDAVTNTLISWSYNSEIWLGQLGALAPAPPTIAQQPSNVSVTAGQTATFTISASGVPTPSYQWQSNASGSFVNIPSATAATYTLASIQLSDSGTQFQCVVSNSQGSVTSAPAMLTVTPALPPPGNAAAPTFNPSGGNFTGTVSFMQDTTVNATIHYSTDGSTPTSVSAVYSQPITLSQTTTINAVAYATGLSSSAMATAVFTRTTSVGPSDPWCTVVNQASPGDTIIFSAGRYPTTCSISVSGAAGSPITLRSASSAPSDQALFSYAGTTNNIFDVSGSNLQFRWLGFGPTAAGAGINPIKLHNSASNLVIDQSIFTNTDIAVPANDSGSTYQNISVTNNVLTHLQSTGLYFGCHDGTSCHALNILIQGNLIDTISPGDEVGYGLEVKLNSYATIKDNTIYRSHGPGLMVYGSNRGDPPSVIEGNYVEGAQTDAGINVGGGPAIVRNNVVVGNNINGIWAQDYNGRGLQQNVWIVNNTVLNNQTGGIGVQNWQANAGNVLAYNAITPLSGTAILNPASPVGAVLGNSTCNPATGCFDQPSTAPYDLWPVTGGPLIGAAGSGSESWRSVDDFMCQPRGSAADSGAFQRTGSGSGPLLGNGNPRLACGSSSGPGPGPGPNPPTLLAPQVNFGSLPINAILTITNASSYSGVTFVWTFTPVAANASSQALGSHASTKAPISAKGPAVEPTTVGLSLGTYQVSVIALDGNNNQSPAATGQITLVAANLSAVRVYPNPWRSDKHAAYGMTFNGLTVGTVIKIFTISAHEVKELRTDGPKIVWDLTNDSGDKVASGVYVYLITDSQGDKVKGKVAVIK